MEKQILRSPVAQVGGSQIALRTSYQNEIAFASRAREELRSHPGCESIVIEKRTFIPHSNSWRELGTTVGEDVCLAPGSLVLGNCVLSGPLYVGENTVIGGNTKIRVLEGERGIIPGHKTVIGNEDLLLAGEFSPVPSPISCGVEVSKKHPELRA